MVTKSREHTKKLRAIRQAEGLTQQEFARLLGIGPGTVRNYESGQKEAGLSIVDKVVRHPRLERYTLWLMTDKTAPAAGQIAPPLSPDGQNETKSPRSTRKVG